MTIPGRPTLRCLIEDLEHDWIDATQRRLIVEGLLDELEIALHDLDHPTVRHLRDTFTGTDSSDAQRVSISGLTNPMWYRLKTGRWRGAVYVDSDGTAWLCAAGLRRGGEAADFYSSFMDRIRTSGPQAFLPTDADRRHASRERAREQLRKWELSLHNASQAALRESVQTGHHSSMPVTSLKDGSVIANALVELVELTEADGSLVEVTLEFCDIDWTATSQVERAQIVIMLAICDEPTVWRPGHSRDSQVFSLYSSDGLDYLVERMQNESRAGLPAEPQLSHYAKKDLLLGSAVNGDAVATLCGVWIVQSCDAEQLPKCPACAEIHEQLGTK